MGFGGELAHQTEHADAASETSSQPEQKCFYCFLFRTPLPREGLGGGVTPPAPPSLPCSQATPHTSHPAGTA